MHNREQIEISNSNNAETVRCFYHLKDEIIIFLMPDSIYRSVESWQKLREVR